MNAFIASMDLLRGHLSSDENALSLLHPRVDLLVRRVDEEVALLVVLDERLHRLDGLAERPPLHLGLEPHVGDLQAEAVPVHAAAGGVVGVGVEVVGEGKWAGIIDWEAAGGCGTHLPGAARPPTGFPLTFLKLSGG